MEHETEKVYYTVMEAADDVGVLPSSIRFWDDKYDVISKRSNKGNRRQITPKELLVFHKINTLMKFMNNDGVGHVLKGDIKIQVNPEIL